MKENNNLFRINNLRCSYQDGKEVLRIENISIPRERLVILLGKSGCGKSTFLETLGLMNNTIVNGDVIYYPGNGTEGISYYTLWNKKKLNDVAQIRREYFSFIFQNTNLMPSFTTYENAYLTELIRGIPIQEASRKIANLLAELGLGEISHSRKTSEMSGGQKQRIAFIRAVASTFNVLFGDEPTGNLDVFNSRELLLFLQGNIRKNRRSAIIVSHNIDLSLQFGDVIMLLSKADRNNEYFELLPEHIFQREGREDIWKNHGKCNFRTDELSLKIQTILENKIEQI